ncbi:MAG TPA: MAPEG family protein [Rhizomicrobium sp.]|nr:MAPEG family protein [Rhizomicrobium sp.]
MTIELTMLVWSLVLAFVQILLFDFARTSQYGLKWNTGPRDETMPPLNPVAGRLQRAQYNLYETLPLFIGGVLVAHIAGRENELTAIGAQVYFWGRVVYVPLYAFGIRQIRSLVWLVSTAGLVALFIPILMPQ